MQLLSHDVYARVDGREKTNDVRIYSQTQTNTRIYISGNPLNRRHNHGKLKQARNLCLAYKFSFGENIKMS
jgi:hypothetical protein